MQYHGFISVAALWGNAMFWRVFGLLNWGLFVQTMSSRVE